MHRRSALAALASALLAACGGGGGGGGGAGQAAPTPTSTSTALAAAAPIALWGDSHTGGLPDDPNVPGIAVKLREIAPTRAVFDGGIAGQTSTQIADRQVRDTEHDDWVTVLWYGGNNQTDSQAIKADLARSIASLAPGNSRFVVLPVINQAVPWERRGTPDYDRIMQLNADLAGLYPENFLDVRSHLVSLYDPNNPADVEDFEADVVPSSLRADGVHLNHAGAMAVAQRLLEFIVAKGW